MRHSSANTDHHRRLAIEPLSPSLITLLLACGQATVSAHHSNGTQGLGRAVPGHQPGRVRRGQCHKRQLPSAAIDADPDASLERQVPPRRAEAGRVRQRAGPLSCTDMCIGIGRIRIRGYGNFLKNPMHGYVYYLKIK